MPPNCASRDIENEILGYLGLKSALRVGELTAGEAIWSRQGRIQAAQREDG
jgi:hypothetical protein